MRHRAQELKHTSVDPRVRLGVSCGETRRTFLSQSIETPKRIPLARPRMRRAPSDHRRRDKPRFAVSPAITRAALGDRPGHSCVSHPGERFLPSQLQSLTRTRVAWPLRLSIHVSIVASRAAFSNGVESLSKQRLRGLLPVPYLTHEVECRVPFKTASGM